MAAPSKPGGVTQHITVRLEDDPRLAPLLLHLRAHLPHVLQGNVGLRPVSVEGYSQKHAIATPLSGGRKGTLRTWDVRSSDHPPHITKKMMRLEDLQTHEQPLAPLLR